MKSLDKTLHTVITILISVLIIGTLSVLLIMGGYSYGYLKATDKANAEIEALLGDVSSAQYGVKTTPEPQAVDLQPRSAPARQQPSWGGPDLWQAVNKRRMEFGVNSLIQRDELCTIASIRLNELLDAGKLDGHEGFSNLPERRPDLKWIFEKYNNVSEFLVSGAQTADHAVELWENTLGHKKLLTGGEYVWGCIYGQNSFGVAITAF